MGPAGSPSRCRRASRSATRAGEASSSGISCAAAGGGAGWRALWPPWGSVGPGAAAGRAGPGRGGSSRVGSGLRRRRVARARLPRGLGASPAVGVRRLPALSCPLPVKKTPGAGCFGAFGLLCRCVFTVALPEVSKKQALRFLIPVRFEVWVWWFFFPRPFVCLNRDLHMEGQIWFLPRSLQLSSFQAYKLRVTHLYQLKQHSILVSVGEDEEGINPLVSQTTRDENALVLGGLP